MSKIVLTKRTSALFFAAILVAGGIFGIKLSSPSTAYGEAYQSAECDNTNVNINIVDASQFQRKDLTNEATNDATTELNGQELTPEDALSKLTGNNNGEPLLNLKRNIVNVCFSNNDNDQSIQVNQAQNQNINPVSCEECFTTNLNPTQLMQLQEFLDVIPLTLEGFCDILSDPTIPNDSKVFVVAAILQQAVGVEVNQLIIILRCLEDLGILTVPPF